MGVGWDTGEGNDWLLGFNDTSTQRKGEEIQETVEEMKEKDWGERGKQELSEDNAARQKRKQSLNSKD